jgi:UDP-glucose:glycoprotein glucosyltransferase
LIPSLVEQIRLERSRILSLVALGLNPKQAYDLLSNPDVGLEQTEAEPVEGLVDASDRPEGENAIVWWNDIEKDKR